VLNRRRLARRGKVAQLRFWALDGRTAEGPDLQENEAAEDDPAAAPRFEAVVVSHVGWRVPKALRGCLRYSVDAVDAAGNHSRRRWAWIAIR
jgi:hypothetical protein